MGQLVHRGEVGRPRRRPQAARPSPQRPSGHRQSLYNEYKLEADSWLVFSDI